MPNLQGVILTSSPAAPVIKIECEDCESDVICTAEDKFCPLCGSELPSVEEPEVVEETDETLQAAFKEPRLLCKGCNATIFSNFAGSDDELSDSVFCPKCGDADVVTVPKENVETKDVVQAGEKCESESDEDSATVEDKIADMEEEKAKEEESGEEDSGLNLEDMEAAFFASETSPFWLLCQSGYPKLKLPFDSKFSAIFGSEEFIDIFIQRAQQASLTSAIREFGAEVLDKTVLTSAEVDHAVFEKLQASFLPRFMECITLAIEGMVRNIYPDLSSELKGAFYDEMKARGIQDPIDVIEAAWNASGSEVFAAIVAKAMELWHKEPQILQELKATILATNKANSSIEADPEHQELKARLVAGNIPVKASSSEPLTKVHQSSVVSLRERLRLGKK